MKVNRFKKLDDREDLWQVLAMLIERNAIAVHRRAQAKKRGGGMNRGESVFANFLGDCSVDGAGGIANVADPNAGVVEVFTLGVRELLEMLDEESLRQVAILRLEGFSNPEIAERLDISLRAVERKVQLIRKCWESHKP
jgi:DNA-directed RNA polymerase specialized sigma24 family protein